MTLKITTPGVPGAFHSISGSSMALTVNCKAAPDGTITPLAAPPQSMALPSDYTVVCEHHLPGRTHCICMHNGQISWTRTDSRPQDQVLAHSDFTPIAICPRVLDCACMRHWVVLATTLGTKYLVWCGDHYSWLGDGPRLPTIEFGLRKAGTLHFSAAIEVPKSMARTATTPDAPPSRPSAATATADRRTAAKTVYDTFASALSLQAYAKGLISQPMYLRYALRLSDGTNIMPSAPVLLLPTVIAPCIGIDHIGAGDNDCNIVTLSNDTFMLFAIRYRLLDSLSAEWHDYVSGIDIFASAPINTYDPDNISDIGASDYDGANGYDAESTLVGNWAVGDDDFCDHSLQSLGWQGVKSWHFNPNPSLSEGLKHPGTFHRIGTLDLDQLTPSPEYQSLPIRCTSPNYIDRQPSLMADNSTLWTASPTSIMAYDGQLLAAGGSMTLPAPSIPSLTASYPLTDASSESDAVEIHVWAKKDGLRLCSHVRYLGSQSFTLPRYLYFPDSGAYKMQISRGNEQWSFQLSPCTTMEGAFWLSQMSMEAPQPSPIANDPDQQIGDELPTPNALLIMRPGYPFALSSSTNVGDGKIIALNQALKSMSQGQFGQYPIYVFATDGVWAMDRKCQSRQKASALAAFDASHIAPTDIGVAFATNTTIAHIHGSKCDTLPQLPIIDGNGISTVNLRLPHLDALLSLVGITPEPIDMAQCKIAYSPHLHAVTVTASANSALTYAYLLNEECWTVIAHNCDSARQHTTAHAATRLMMIVTKAMRLPLAPLSRIELHGPHHVIGAAIYGSDDQCQWRPLSTARCRHIPPILTPKTYHGLIAIFD